MGPTNRALLSAGALASILLLLQLLNSQEIGGISWRPGVFYLLVTIAGVLVASTVYLLPSPRFFLALLVIAFFVLAGQFSALISVILLATSGIFLGRLASRGVNDLVVSLLLGLSIIATVLFWAGMAPVNYWPVWLIGLLAPIVVGLWFDRGSGLSQCFKSFFRRRPNWQEPFVVGLSLPIGLVTLMPEIGHDALVFHLYLPTFVSDFGLWSYTPEVNGIGQRFVNWLFAVGFMFGGEVGARAVNALGLLVSARLIFLLAKNFGASRTGAFIAAALYLTTPVVFLEAASLFVENWWTAFLLAAVYKFRLMLGARNAWGDYLQLGLLLGGALSSKAISIPLLAVGLIIALVFYGLPRKMGIRDWLALAPGAAIGLSSYVLSTVATGNPVFPYFNGFFQSPHFPVVSFSGPWPPNLSPAVLVAWTFNSPAFVEGSIGSGGFQWLFLVLPAVTGLALFSRSRGIYFLIFLAFGWIAGVFFQTAYLRYVLPAFALFLVLVGVAWSNLWARERKAQLLASLGVGFAILLNIVHLNAATWYGQISHSVIFDDTSRQQYIDAVLPVRQAINKVNSLNTENQPVAFLGTSSVAYIQAKAVHTNWYDPEMNSAISSSQQPEDFSSALERRNVAYLVVNVDSMDENFLGSLEQISSKVSQFGAIEVRKVEID